MFAYLRRVLRRKTYVWTPALDLSNARVAATLMTSKWS